MRVQKARKQTTLVGGGNDFYVLMLFVIDFPIFMAPLLFAGASNVGKTGMAFF